MNKNHINGDFSGLVNVDIKLRDTCNENKKSNKCNQCEYTSSAKSTLRSHLKMHSGERSHKCSLCNFAFVNASNLRKHLKTHSGVKSKNATYVTMPLLKQAI